MAEFFIDLKKMKGAIKEEEKAAQEMTRIRVQLENQMSGINGLGTEFSYVKGHLAQILNDVKLEERELIEYKECLENVVKMYEETEQRIVSQKIAEQSAKEQKEETDTKDEIEKAYEDGVIDKEIYDVLKSALSGFGAFSMATIRNALTGVLQDKSAEAIANTIWNWLRENTTLFMDRGMVAALAGGGEMFLTEAPSWLASSLRGGVKFGIPFVGTLIDYSLQVAEGEDTGDALAKAVGHTAIGFAGATAGAKIGALVGSVIPVAGTAVGAVAGAVIGAAGSVAFDYIYDNLDNIVEGAGDILEGVGDWIEDAGDSIGGWLDDVGEGIGDWAQSAGNAVADVFGGLGSVFG